MWNSFKSKKISVLALTLSTLLAILLIAVVSNIPTTHYFGVDYKVFSRKIPLYEKGVLFVSRHLEVQRVLKSVIEGTQPGDAQLLHLYEWTRDSIKNTPPGFSVYDDHIFYTLIRGYGAADQQAYVLALLAYYSGYSAAVAKLSALDEKSSPLQINVIRAKDKTVLFDVFYRVILRDLNGALADVQDIQKNPAIVSASLKHLAPTDAVHYAERLKEFKIEKLDFERIKRQDPWLRPKLELYKYANQ